MGTSYLQVILCGKSLVKTKLSISCSPEMKRKCTACYILLQFVKYVIFVSTISTIWLYINNNVLVIYVRTIMAKMFYITCTSYCPACSYLSKITLIQVYSAVFIIFFFFSKWSQYDHKFVHYIQFYSNIELITGRQ